ISSSENSYFKENCYAETQQLRHISQKRDYNSGIHSEDRYMRAPAISLKTEQDVEKLRTCGRWAAEGLALVGEHVQPGVTTEDLDELCHDFTINTLKVTPASIGYYGDTKTTCISPDEVVCHGIPASTAVLQGGDIINIDVAIIKD